jgi:hypothetical protein
MTSSLPSRGDTPVAETPANPWREVVRALDRLDCGQDLIKTAWCILGIVYMENVDRERSGKPCLNHEEWLQCCGKEVNAFRASVLAKQPELREAVGTIDEYELYRHVILPLALPSMRRRPTSFVSE